MTPIPSPTMGYPGQAPFPGGMDGFPSEAMMRRIMMEQQQRMNQGEKSETRE